MTTKETESDKDKRIASLEARMTALENKKRVRKPRKKKVPEATENDAIPPDFPFLEGRITLDRGSSSQMQLEFIVSQMQKEMTALRNKLYSQDNSMKSMKNQLDETNQRLEHQDNSMKSIKSQLDETNQRLKQLESTISPPAN